MTSNKIPLELILKVSINCKFYEFAVMSYNKLGLSHKSICLLLDDLDRSIEAINLEEFCECLKKIHSALLSIPLDQDLIKVHILNKLLFTI
jgi:hypothetical protein